MSELLHSVIRTLGFVAKELIGVLRQPRLILSLVLGPFLILLVFGFGFRGHQPEFRTVLVVPNDPSVSDRVDDYRDGFAGVFKLQEVTRDQAHAEEELKKDQTDIVVSVPPDVYDQIYGGRQVQLPVLYSEIDPTQGAWVKYFAYVQVSELNRRILTEVLKQSKGPDAQARDYAGQIKNELDALDSDVRAGNYQSSATRVAALLASTQAARGGLARAMDTVAEGRVEPSTSGIGQAAGLLLAFEQDLVGLQGDLARSPSGQSSAAARAQDLRDYSQRFDELAARIQGIPAETLVTPFVASTRNIVPVQPTAIAFYTPAVLALLLQHIGVTLAVMSAVRDRLLGTMELFRVSPVGAGNIIFGKTIGFALVLACVAIALTTAATMFLGVPSLGDPRYYWLSLGLTVFAAVALGFALSTIADTESQAVQMSMLVLLASVFFSGLFLRLDQLFPWVHFVSYLLPVTYGAIDLREVMLRGMDPSWPSLLGQLGLGSLFYLLATFGLRRQMRRA